MATKAKNVPLKGQKQEKKATASQLERRLKNAVLHLDKTKETKSVYFSDKGLRLTQDVVEGYTIVETGFHKHVFTNFTSSGVSHPTIYIGRVIDFAYNNDCIVKDARGDSHCSFSKLHEVLKAKEDKNEYYIMEVVSWWLTCIFAPLYRLSADETSQFLTYENYMHEIAVQSFLLDEHKEDVTNKSFVDAILEREKSFIEGMEESVILKAKSDEERMQEEMEAMQEQEQESQMTE